MHFVDIHTHSVPEADDVLAVVNGLPGGTMYMVSEVASE